MLKNIKSSFFIQKLLSHLIDVNKLQLIKYSKLIQEMVKINLIDYKLFTGKKITYESKNKGKEYTLKGILLYEGEYLNGRRNGKGKEYDKIQKLIFEGEYLNGKKNGKGIEYHLNNKIKFEGEYLNGERNGKGKEYDVNSNLIFEGEYLNGKRWTGIGYYYNQFSHTYKLEKGTGFQQEYEFSDQFLVKGQFLKFEGEYLNGEKHGKGKEYYSDGKLKFEGFYKYGKKWDGKTYEQYTFVNNNQVYDLIDGKGHFKESIFADHNFEGEFLNGERNGIGKEYDYSNGSLEYEGEYLNGKKNGKGKEFTINKKLKFEGEYLDGERHGLGKEYDFNGLLVFEGEFMHGKKKGKGKEFNDKGKIIFEGEYVYGWRRRGKEYIGENIEFEGEYLFNKKWNGIGYDGNGGEIYKLKNGTGTVREYDYSSGVLKFEGELVDGIKQGKGKEYFPKGNLKFEGEYSNGKRNGKGKEYDIKGNLKFEGNYVNGEKKK